MRWNALPNSSDRSLYFRQTIEVRKLITCDILCHGVGSPGIWLRFVEINSEFDYVTFKDKRDDWLSPRCIARSSGKEVSLRRFS